MNAVTATNNHQVFIRTRCPWKFSTEISLQVFVRRKVAITNFRRGSRTEGRVSRYTAIHFTVSTKKAMDFVVLILFVATANFTGIDPKQLGAITFKRLKLSLLRSTGLVAKRLMHEVVAFFGRAREPTGQGLAPLGNRPLLPPAGLEGVVSESICGCFMSTSMRLSPNNEPLAKSAEVLDLSQLSPTLKNWEAPKNSASPGTFSPLDESK